VPPQSEQRFKAQQSRYLVSVTQVIVEKAERSEIPDIDKKK